MPRVLMSQCSSCSGEMADTRPWVHPRQPGKLWIMRRNQAVTWAMCWWLPAKYPLAFPHWPGAGKEATQRHWGTYPSACDMLAFIILQVVLPKLVALDASFCVPAWAVGSRQLGSRMCPVLPQASETQGLLDFWQWQNSVFSLVSVSWYSIDGQRTREGNYITMTSYMAGLNYVCQSALLYYNTTSETNAL